MDKAALESKKLSLILTQDNLADLILNFLGKKQRLSYEEEKPFVIKKDDLIQAYYLIKQKIGKEQLTNINSFSTSIIYEDNTTREFTGIEELQNFYEVRNISPLTVTLEWNIILEFADTNNIENQKIDLTFVRNSENQRIYLNIEHTNQIWANEILNLIKEHISTVINEKENILKLAEKIDRLYKADVAGLWIMIILMSFGYIMILNDKDEKNNIAKKQMETMIKIKNINKENNVNDSDLILGIYILEKNIESNASKIINNKEIASVIQDNFKNQPNKETFMNTDILKAIFVILGSIIAIKLFVKQNIKYYEYKSFILLTNKSEQEYEKFKDNKSKTEYYSLTFIAVTIMIGVIGTFIVEVIK